MIQLGSSIARMWCTEEQDEEGDGGNSDEEAEDTDFHDSVMRTVMAEWAEAQNYYFLYC